MEMRQLDHSHVLNLLPDRDAWGHKGDFGKILLLCGSRGFTGAAYFAAMGALRCGAGLVYLGVPESIYGIEAGKLNEPVVFPLPEKDGKLSQAALEDVLPRLMQMDAVVLGCGLGRSEETTAVIQAVLQQATCPVVLDADGINGLAGHMDVVRRRAWPTILTPHDGEFLRMGGQLGPDRMASAAETARDLGCIVLLKGHRTCITDGIRGYRNLTGNPGMAVGGSGDVLAGMILSLIGQGLRPADAARVGAWLHGRCGDVCANRLSEYGMTPTDMLGVLPEVLHEYNTREW